jgi:hypothetical protein
MFSRTKRDANEERLDAVGKDLVRAARASEEEIEGAVVGPLLYSRIRASIAARQRELEGPAGGWLGFVRAARLAVPAMALVTVAVTFIPRLGLTAKRHLNAVLSRTEVTALIATPQPPRILVFSAGACALSNNEECAISNNELLATLFAADDQETLR